MIIERRDSRIFLASWELVAEPITSLIWCGQELSQKALLELTMAVTVDITWVVEYKILRDEGNTS